jgi:hypothetical protein
MIFVNCIFLLKEHLMSKKKKNSKKASSSSVKESIKPKKKNSFNLNDINNKNLWLLGGVLAIVYFIFSTFSDGFYMHDEPMFYIYGNDFWSNPKAELLRFQKLGYVLFLSIPSLAGFTFLHFFNSVFSAITVIYSYKIINKIGGKNSFLIFFLLGIQPLWFMLSFRNYSEFLTAFLLIMAVWNHFNKKYIFAALLLSYAALTRSEYHIFLGIYFIILIIKKQWIAALLSGTFTVLHNLTGYIITDDILYLPNRVISYSEKMSNVWPKRGFDHYLDMSNVIFGSVTLTLFISYFSLKILKKEKPLWIIAIPALFIILLNCSLNALSFDFGPGNGGNLRYLIPIAPFVAILAALAIDDILNLKKKHLLLIFLVPFLFFVTAYQTYDHDFMKLLVDGDRQWFPAIIALITVAIIILPLKQKQYLIALPILTIFIAIASVRTFPLNPEDATMKKAGKWFSRTLEQGKKQGENALIKEDSQIACSHVLFYYFSEKNKKDFIKPPIKNFTKEGTDTLKRGDIVIWDSHYGYRPRLRATSQPYEYYDKNKDYEKIQYYQSKDNRFLVAFFRKIKD